MEVKILENGTTAIALEVPNSKIAVLNILVKAGSAMEEYGKSGLAHFLEHMMFEGSKNYPNYDKTLYSLLGENNAFTAQDYTNYYSIVPNENLEAAIDLEIDRLENLNLEKREFEIQKNVILEEFVETSIEPPLADVWHKILPNIFGKSSYGWPVIGKSLKEFRNLTLEDLKQFYNRYYSPENIIFCIAGSQNANETIKMLAKKLEKMRPRNIEKKDFQNKVSNFIPKRKIYYRNNIDQQSFYWTFPIGDFSSETHFVADMISDLISSGEESLLYQELIKKKKICSSIFSYVTDNKSGNLMIIEGKLNPNKTYKELGIELWKLLEKIKTNPVESDYKMKMIINKSIMNFHVQNYSILNRAQNSCFYYYANSSPEEYLEYIRNLNLDNLKKVLQNFLVKENLLEVLYVPKK